MVELTDMKILLKQLQLQSLSINRPCKFAHTSSIAMRFSNPLAWIFDSLAVNPGVAINSGVTYSSLTDGFPESRSS